MTNDLSILRQQSTVRRVVQDQSPVTGFERAATPQIVSSYFGQEVTDNSNLWGMIENAAGKIADRAQEAEAEKDINAQAINYAVGQERLIEDQAKLYRSQYSDPDEFLTQWDKFSGTILKHTSGPFQDSVKNMLSRSGAREYAGLENERKAINQMQAKTALEDAAHLKRNSLISMIDEGHFGTQVYDEIMDEYVSSVRTSAKMGFMSPEEADIAIDKTLADVQVKSILNTGLNAATLDQYDDVVKIYNGIADKNVTQKMLDNITKSSFFDLDQEQKQEDFALKEINDERSVLGRNLYELIYSNQDVSMYMEEYGFDLAPSDFKVAVAASRGVVPYQSDDDTLYMIDQLSPDEAIEEAKSGFAQGKLSKNDLKSTMDQADILKKQPTTYAEQAMQDIAKSLKTPPYMKKQAPILASLRSYKIMDFQNWLQSNPDATDTDIDNKLKSIRRFSHRQILENLPKPYGVNAPKDKMTLENVGLSAQKVMEDYKDGKISHNRMMEAAEQLDTWEQFLKDETYAGFND